MAFLWDTTLIDHPRETSNLIHWTGLSFWREDVRVVGHKCLPDTTFALVGKHKQAESHYESTTYDKKQFVPRNVYEVQFT